MLLAKTVRDHRKKLGWTQRELAEAAGVYHPRVAEIETGRSRSEAMALKLLKAMGFRMQAYVVPLGAEFELRRKDVNSPL